MGGMATMEESMSDQVREADKSIARERYKWQQNKTEPLFRDIRRKVGSVNKLKKHQRE